MLSNNSYKKYTEISLENLYVDIKAKSVNLRTWKCNKFA